MIQSLESIAELAEFIAEENFSRGSVSLERIARNNNVGLHYGNFENYFTGMLQHENNEFDIYVNLDKLKSKKYPRTRFTIAHELGHYYIDAHRNLLKKGYSLSYDKDLSYFSNDPVEKEANHFATNLLMPKKRFSKDISNLDIGINAIKELSKKYKTSITSTIIQYRNLVEYPCSLLFFGVDRDFKRKNHSDTFYNIIKRFSTNFHLNEKVTSEIFEGFDDLFCFRDTTSINTTLSFLYPDITTGSQMDIPIIIGTMNLQKFGYVSLVFIVDQ